jgi:hypothetical protein
MSDTAITPPRPSSRDVEASSANETKVPGAKPTESLMSPTGVAFKVNEAIPLASVIPTDVLWETVPGTRSQVVRALELLKEACDNLTQARAHQNALDADRFVQRVQSALPKLFACREISDGYGLTINSLHFAFLNLNGIPLTRDQLDVVWRITRELKRKPIISIEQGIQLAETLEEAGLQVDPPDLAELVGEFSDNE